MKLLSRNKASVDKSTCLQPLLYLSPAVLSPDCSGQIEPALGGVWCWSETCPEPCSVPPPSLWHGRRLLQTAAGPLQCRIQSSICKTEMLELLAWSEWTSYPRVANLHTFLNRTFIHFFIDRIPCCLECGRVLRWLLQAYWSLRAGQSEFLPISIVKWDVGGH